MIDRKLYRAHPALNASYLKQIYAHSKWAADIPMGETPAMKLGTLAHTMILEPDTFADEYTVLDVDRRTKAGKEEYIKALELGKTIVNTDEVTVAMDMARAVKDQTYELGIFDGAYETEISMLFDSPYYSGVECKGQIDLYTGERQLVDLKTTRNIEAAEKQFFNMHYDLQLAFYRDALRANGYPVTDVSVLFVETAPPYQVAYFKLSVEVLENGVNKIKAAMDKYFEQSQYAGPQLRQRVIDLPDWASVGYGDDSDLSPFR